MAKITKSNFKNVVKECLIEILQEGIAGVQPLNEEKTSRLHSRQSQPQRSNSFKQKNSGYAEMKKQVAPARDPIENVVSQMTSDPVLAGIFADTASTTMVEQSTAERLKGAVSASPTRGDRATQKAAAGDPLELFSESANNWAALAFPDSKTRK